MFTDTDNQENTGSSLNRRSFLRLLTVAGGSLLLPSAVSLSANLLNSISDTADRHSTGIPNAWLKEKGPTLAIYSAYLAKIPLRHITVAQIIEPHLKSHGRVHNSIPPKSLWKNISKTLQVADKLAVHINEPVQEVISAYRNPAYNATCPGGKSNSMHLKNNALDLVFRTSPRKVALAARELRSKGLFSGGIGRYPGFTHIDTRGYDADWGA